MRNYLITVITVSICVGIFNIISPHVGGLEKYSKIIGTLIVLCVMIAPIKDLMSLLGDDGFENIKNDIIDFDGEQNEYDEIFKDYLSRFSISELESEIKSILLEKYEIPNNECEVTVSTDETDGKISPSRIQILLSGKSIFKNPYIIEEHFANLLGCSCQVLIK